MKRAIIFLSGGMDSTTCLAIAKSQGYACYALTFNYGQRNFPEIECAKRIAQQFEVAEHRIFKLDLNQWGGSALTDHDIAVPQQRSNDVPITYVPARNTVFLSIALSWAEAVGANNIFFGANADDHLNYPDCRPEYIKAFEQLANLATREGTFKIHTPLLALDKVAIVKQGQALGVDYDMTLSCYDPSSDGVPCGTCDACHFRQQAFL